MEYWPCESPMSRAEKNSRCLPKYTLKARCENKKGSHAHVTSWLSEPPVGIEPTTYWLQVSCSTSWAKEAFWVEFSGKNQPKKQKWGAKIKVVSFFANKSHETVRRYLSCSFSWCRWSLATFIFSLNSSRYFSALSVCLKNSRLFLHKAMSFSTLLIFFRIACSFWYIFLSAWGSPLIENQMPLLLEKPNCQRSLADQRSAAAFKGRLPDSPPSRLRLARFSEWES